MLVDGKPGFIVRDMTDVDRFEPIVPLPDSRFYLVHDADDEYG